MRLAQWSCVALSVLFVVTAAEAQLAPTGWVFFDPNESVRQNPGDPPTTFEAVANTRMILGPGLTATIDPQTGVLNDIYTGRVVDPRTLSGYDPRLGSAFDPNTDLPIDPNLGVVVEPDMGVFLDFKVPGMSVNRVVAYPYYPGTPLPISRGVTFHRVSIPNCGMLRNVGSPELPVLSRDIVVPVGAKVSLEVISSDSRSIRGYNMYPVQPSRERQDGPIQEPFVIDWSRYDTNEDYPAEMATVVDKGIFAGQRVVILEVHPVRCNPVTNTATVYSNVEIALKYDLPDANVPVSPGRVPGATAPSDGSRGPGTIHALDDKTEPGCDYLIITPELFYKPQDPCNGIVKLVEWKRRKGYLTRVVTLGEIPRPSAASPITAEDIREYLGDAYHHWSPKPTYVLLVGDVRDDEGGMLLPTHYSTAYSAKGVATDLYYATLDGDDYLPDLYVGRLSVDTLEQANAVIEKILAYEIRPPKLPLYYYGDVSLVQLFEDRDWNGQEDATFRIIESAEKIQTHLQTAGYDRHLIYNQSGSTIPGPQWYQDGSTLPEYLKFPGFPWDGETWDILEIVGNGCFLVAYNGHGSPTFWSLPRFDTTNVGALTNGANIPLVLSLACNTGWFDNEVAIPNAINGMECFCEEFLRPRDGGAVAVIGSSRSSYEDNDYLILGMFSAIWPGLTPQLNVLLPDAPATGPWDRMGQINTYGKLVMMRDFSHGTMTPLHFELYNLFGDPEMRLWTQEPKGLSVDVPTARGQDIEVYVTDETGAPVSAAVVVLTCANTEMVLRQETDAQGYGCFTVDVTEPCKLTLTVTAPNCRPYMGKVQSW